MDATTGDPDVPAGRTAARATELGWALGQSYQLAVGGGRRRHPSSPATLPTSDELSGVDSALRLVDLAASSARALSVDGDLLSPVLLADLRAAVGPARSPLAGLLEEANLEVQRGLACRSLQLETAYNLGLLLSGLTALPARAATDDRGEWRERLLAAHDTVRDLASVLPEHASQAVRESMARWGAYLGRDGALQRVVRTPFGMSASGEDEVAAVFARQVTQWAALLTGAKDPLDCLTAASLVDASIGTLRGLRRQAARAAAVMWPVLAVLVAATAGVCVVALLEAHGSAKSTTTLATVVAALGAGWRAVRTPSRSAFLGFAHRFAAAETDCAIADTITLLPPDASAGRVRRLAARKVAVPASTDSPAREASDPVRDSAALRLVGAGAHG